MCEQAARIYTLMELYLSWLMPSWIYKQTQVVAASFLSLPLNMWLLVLSFFDVETELSVEFFSLFMYVNHHFPFLCLPCQCTVICCCLTRSSQSTIKYIPLLRVVCLQWSLCNNHLIDLKNCSLLFTYLLVLWPACWLLQVLNNADLLDYYVQLRFDNLSITRF